MAMYYQEGSEHHQTFYLMNPNYAGYSDHPTNMLLFNSPGTTSSNAMHTHQQVVSIPISHDPNRPSPVSGHQRHIPAPHDTLPRLGYNSWADQECANMNQPNMVQHTQQGLSLSLSTNQSVILGSKYLKAAQQLLDQVVSVGKRFMANYDKGDQGSKDKAKINKGSNNHYGDSTEGTSVGGELTTAQRQEIQMKKAKLISMLDEVEQRYRQYNIQMHIIVASFEQTAGIGSAKSYTQLALETISKQFRCLKDAISAQIYALSKSLGEEEKIEGSKLKYVDNQLRQHRAMQQLGMVQNNAWRPQRGLPERAVSVFRAWLFDHFLHPYPKDTDKQMLAKQTGLTRGQVSNWFINARVRLWKPMVEEMYLEEMKNQQETDNPSKTSPDHHQSNFNSTIPKNVTNPSTTTEASFHGKYNNAQNTVSLTLGLPSSKTSPGTQNFFDFGTTNEAELLVHEKVNNINIGYEQILGLNQNRNPFPAQLLPDFVA